MAQNERLFAHDFDGTSHLTGEPAPNGMTVPFAYEHAVEKVLGDDALGWYREEGGLRNRAPFEVVQQLLPEADTDTQRQKTEDLIEAKLSVLLNQVGMRIDDTFWPRLNPGFRRLWMPASAEPTITTGTVSSGHEKFIRRAFDVHDLEAPDVFVTDDDMRPLLALLPSELCVKPSRLLLDLVHAKWLARSGNAAEVMDDLEALQTSRERILYAGDDYKKDRMLAKNAGVRFIHIEAARPEAAFEHIARVLNLEAGHGQ